MRPRATTLLLMAGCIETGLTPAESGVAPPPDVDTSWVPPLAETLDTGPTADECSLLPAAASAATGSATCSALEAVDWELALKFDYQNVTDEDSWAAIAAPAVAPSEPGALPIVAFQVDEADGMGSVRVIDPRAGAIMWELQDAGANLDHLAIARDALADGSGQLRFVVQTVSMQVACAAYDGTMTTLDLPEASGAPSVRDITHDGVPEGYQDPVVVDAACATLYEAEGPWWSGTPILYDTTGGFDDALANSGGSTLLGGATSPWIWDGEFRDSSIYNFAILADGGQPRILVLNSDWLMLARIDGQVEWTYPIERAPVGFSQNAPTVGDVDGDGRPEIIIAETDWLSAFNLDGDRIWTVQLAKPWGPAGGFSMADLDADGRFEIVHWCENGLRILDGETGLILGAREDVFTLAARSEPLIADVDGDNSAEILVVGDWVDEAGESSETLIDHLFIFGPATGRWARTRQVWNQAAYDITTIRDDGAIVRFPRASWQTYNAFRAQPSHDGDHADLTLEVSDTCVDVCGAGGTVKLAVQASNLGSADAAAGARVTLYTWSEMLGVVEVGAATLSGAIASGQAADGVVFEVPWENWGEGRFVQIDASDGDDCDLVNSRIDVFADPCGEP